jgi:hypothetical protein
MPQQIMLGDQNALGQFRMELKDHEKESTASN